MAVRHERVVLDLQDNLTPGLLRASAAAGVLDKSLNGLNDRNVAVARSVNAAAPELDRFGASARRAGSDIDSLSGRLGLLTDAALVLGPAIFPLGAVGGAALATLATSFAAVGVAAGTTAIAFGGVGEALEAMNKAHLDPTKENLKEAEEALNRLAPAAQDFVEKMDSLRGLGADIRTAGAQGLFPGLTDALDALETRGPEAVRIVEAINREVGDLARDSARDLASPRWNDFFRMIERESPRTLDSLGTSLGNVAHGASEVLEAFVPLNRDGLGWLEGATADFDRWATGLRRNEDFQSFVSYVRENGPQVADTLGSIASAGVRIAEALSPLGGPSLKAIEGLADAVGGIAGSDLGPLLLGGFAAYRLGRRVPGVRGLIPGIGGAAGGLGGGGVVPVFVTNPGFGGPGGAPGVVGGAPGGRGGFGKIARSIPFVGTALAVGEVARSEVNSPDYRPGSVGGGILGSGVGRSVARLNVEVDTSHAENKFSWVDREIERITGRTARPKADLEDKSARNKLSWVDAEIGRLTGRTARPRADLNDQASGPISRVAGMLSALDGRVSNTTIRTTYVTRRVNEGTGSGFGPTDFGVADGGTVPGQRQPYGDKIRAVLAPGEEVISNRYGQADRHRALLKAINANRYANGGTVGRASNPGAPVVSLDGLTLRANVEGMGEVMFRVARSEIDAHDRWQREQSPTR